MNSTRLFGLVMALLYLASVTAFSPAAVSSANVHAASTAPARAHARARVRHLVVWWIDRRAHDSALRKLWRSAIAELKDSRLS